MLRRSLLLASMLTAVVAGVRAGAVTQAFTWDLPPGFPQPLVPADNAMTPARVTLGRYLFYDTRLSGNGTQSCATCHEQSRAFTDPRPISIGSTGEPHPRTSMSLANIAYAPVLTWANPTMRALETQMEVPMFGEHPIELGLPADNTWLDRLRGDARYPALFAAAYPDEAAPVTRPNVMRAIASFERTLISGRSPYDRYHFDRDDSAVTPAVKRGEVLFHSQSLSCFTCHAGFNFSGAVQSVRQPTPVVEFHNTGLYNLPGALSYPAENPGIFAVTGDAGDVGRFKAPTLRNIAVTAPYMHDGSVATLEDVLAHYAAGGRTIAEGPHAGIGHDNPNKSPTVRGFTLTAEERADVIAFLRSLTDERFLTNPDFSNPFPPGTAPLPAR